MGHLSISGRRLSDLLVVAARLPDFRDKLPRAGLHGKRPHRPAEPAGSGRTNERPFATCSPLAAGAHLRSFQSSDGFVGASNSPSSTMSLIACRTCRDASSCLSCPPKMTPSGSALLRVERYGRRLVTTLIDDEPPPLPLPLARFQRWRWSSGHSISLPFPFISWRTASFPESRVLRPKSKFIRPNLVETD